MEENLPDPNAPEEGYVILGGHELCEFDGRYCFRHHRCFTGDPVEGLVDFCERYQTD